MNDSLLDEYIQEERSTELFKKALAHYKMYIPTTDFSYNITDISLSDTAKAKKEFNQVEKVKEKRVKNIAEFLALNEVNYSLVTADFTELNTWIRENVYYEKHSTLSGDVFYKLHPVWFSIAFDLGLLLEKHVLSIHPNLDVKLNTWFMKKMIGRNLRVVTGFVHPPYKGYGIDFPLFVVQNVSNYIDYPSVAFVGYTLLDEVSKYNATSNDEGSYRATSVGSDYIEDLLTSIAYQEVDTSPEIQLCRESYDLSFSKTKKLVLAVLVACAEEGILEVVRFSEDGDEYSQDIRAFLTYLKKLYRKSFSYEQLYAKADYRFLSSDPRVEIYMDNEDLFADQLDVPEPSENIDSIIAFEIAKLKSYLLMAENVAEDLNGDTN